MDHAVGRILAKLNIGDDGVLRIVRIEHTEHASAQGLLRDRPTRDRGRRVDDDLRHPRLDRRRSGDHGKDRDRRAQPPSGPVQAQLLHGSLLPLHDELKAVVFDFAEGRGGQYVRGFLGLETNADWDGWHGKLVCDDFSSYNACFELGVTEVGCLATHDSSSTNCGSTTAAKSASGR